MRKKNKLIFGVGTNDADYEVYKYVDNKIVWICPVYKDWKDMLRRVYCKNYQQKYQTYKNVSICAEWLILSNFRDWVLNVQPNKNWENCVLDKDVLTFDSPKKEYSATNCCYISKMVNNFILDSRQNRDSEIRGYSVDKISKDLSLNVLTLLGLHLVNEWDTSDVFLQQRKPILRGKSVNTSMLAN